MTTQWLIQELPEPDAPAPTRRISTIRTIASRCDEDSGPWTDEFARRVVTLTLRATRVELLFDRLSPALRAGATGTYTKRVTQGLREAASALYSLFLTVTHARASNTPYPVARYVTSVLDWTDRIGSAFEAFLRAHVVAGETVPRIEGVIAQASTRLDDELDPMALELRQRWPELLMDKELRDGVWVVHACVVWLAWLIRK
jgi:hypothetical protein